MSLFSKAKYEEMDKFLVDKVNHNLNFVLCLEDQASLDRMTKDYPFISINCIVNYYTPWTDDTMIAISEDRSVEAHLFSIYLPLPYIQPLKLRQSSLYYLFP